jgi:Bystin
MQAEISVGALVLDLLESGNDYESVASRNLEEVEEAKMEIKGGSLPKLFSVPSKSVLAPKCERDFGVLLEMLDMKRAPYAVIEKLTEKVLSYPQKYEGVKRLFGGVLREIVLAHLAKDRRLDRLLFKSLMLLVSRNPAVFSQTIVLPLLSSPDAERFSIYRTQILARVVMKAKTNRDYMQVFVEDLMRLPPSPAASTLLMAVFIKKLKLGTETLEAWRDYALQCCKERGLYLAWNNMVLAFARGYADRVDMSSILCFYEALREKREIEKEIIEEIKRARARE